MKIEEKAPVEQRIIDKLKRIDEAARNYEFTYETLANNVVPELTDMLRVLVVSYKETQDKYDRLVRNYIELEKIINDT